MEEIILKLNVEKLNVILMGLQELPAKHSLALILELKEEGEKQLQKQSKMKVDK